MLGLHVPTDNDSVHMYIGVSIKEMALERCGVSSMSELIRWAELLYYNL